MARYNRKGRFKVVYCHDGCYIKDLSIEIPMLSSARRTVRELMRMGYKFENLDIIDLEVGRYISFRL